MLRAMICVSLFGVFAGLANAAWGQESGPFCFRGNDALGGESTMELRVARAGQFFEYFGQIGSENFGQANIKIEGNSGTGKIYTGHEYESGAIVVNVVNYDRSSFDLKVGDFGIYRYTLVPCLG
jgi:hypothetical protein